MNDAIESLTKLAQDLTDRLEVLEKENSALRAEAEQVKKASADVVPAPKISEQVVNDTIGLMLKAGMLDATQADDGREKLLNDPNAACRVLQGLIDAQLQAKQASAKQHDDDVTGGRLAGADSSAKTPQDECLDRMMRILRHV